MTAIKLIYFAECPNAETARNLLRNVGVSFDEVRQDDLPPTDSRRLFTSPTILSGDRIVVGSNTRVGGGGCSLDIPSADELTRRLGLRAEAVRTPKKWRALSVVGSVFSGLTVGFCPVCIPAIGAFLSAIGMGFLAQESVLKPLLLVFLAITLSGFVWSYLREHGRLGPLVVGTIFAVGLYISRYVYLGDTINPSLMYGSIAGIVAVSFWNIRLKRKFACCSCAENPNLGGKP
jgi:hypothetical protein